MSEIRKLQITNIIKDLFTFSSAKSTTSYMNGVKAITIILITFYHSYMYKVMMTFENGENLQKYTTEIFYQFIELIIVIMDIFFFIGGFLTAMSLKKGLKTP